MDANRPYLRRWLPWLDANRTVDHTKEFIERVLRLAEEKKCLNYVVVHEGRLCGVCGFHEINPVNRAGYIGYWVSEDAQGNGLITEGCQELERIGFGELGLNKIEIHAASGNAPSRAVAERLGYEQTGILLDNEWLYDHYVDHVTYCKRSPEREVEVGGKTTK